MKSELGFYRLLVGFEARKCNTLAHGRLRFDTAQASLC